MTEGKGLVTTVKWPSDNEAAQRFEALRLRDHELVDAAKVGALAARVDELQQENEYFRILTKFRAVGKPGWLWVKLTSLAMKVLRRLLKIA